MKLIVSPVHRIMCGWGAGKRGSGGVTLGRGRRRGPSVIFWTSVSASGKGRAVRTFPDHRNVFPPGIGVVLEVSNSIGQLAICLPRGSSGPFSYSDGAVHLAALTSQLH